MIQHIKLTSGFRLLTSKTEFPGTPATPGIAIRPVTAEVVIARGPSAPGTAGTERPEKIHTDTQEKKWVRHSRRFKSSSNFIVSVYVYTIEQATNKMVQGHKIKTSIGFPQRRVICKS